MVIVTVSINIIFLNLNQIVIVAIITLHRTPFLNQLYMGLKVNPESGVPLSCLPAYFEACDAYAQRVDQEVTIIMIIRIIRIMRQSSLS